MDSEIKVSIYCLCYNHVQYLAQTIESIVTTKNKLSF